MRFVGILAAMVPLVFLTVGSVDAATPRDALVLRPGVAVGEVRLGMTFSQVRRALGTSLRVWDRDEDLGGSYVEYTFGRDAVLKVGVYTEPGTRTGRVVAVTTSRRVRTRAGVGVGSTHKALQKRLGARCYRERVGIKIYAPHLDWAVCYLGRADQTPITEFWIDYDCSRPTDRYARVCATDKRVYRAAGVTIVSKLGQSVLGGPCRYERAYRERCE